MFKKEITYVDFDGVSRTEPFYFNLTKAEIIEYENSKKGGVSNLLQKIISSEDNVQLVQLFKEFIMMSYGEKSADGRRFIKSKELSEAFAQTEAYSELFMQLCTDADFASKFVNGVISQPQADPNKKSLASQISLVK